ncbi:MAG: GspH/FimT family pseudopilin [Proteobacteria bacterium]|nr:GspH/FimT family pseudopilin [Pseudomonadota bacterium]MDE3208126.1 GspH/FimT family pseudopilin [Pseudomonadota bacterium]
MDSYPPIMTPCSGVTLIELMLAIFIMSLLLALTLPSYSSWIQENQIRTVAESALNGLQSARDEAVKTNSLVTLTFNGTDWTVTPDNSTTVITQSSGNATQEPNATLQTSLNPITFNGLGQVSPPSTVTINITDPKGGNCLSASPPGTMRCLNIVVQSGGALRLCDPALPATNAQSCEAS